MAVWKKLNPETGEYEVVSRVGSISSGGVPITPSITEAVYMNVPDYVTRKKTEVREIHKYPLYPLFGGEYLYPYYKKLFNNETIVIACDGDSTTECAYVSNGGKRSQIVEKIFRIGQYENVTVHNNGLGGTSSGDYVGSDFVSDKTATTYPNGMMETSINQDADLILFMFGINDTDKNSDTLTLDERMTQFRENVIEFLERLRGSTDTTYNDRPCYGRTVDDTCVILVNPFPYLHLGFTESDERYLWSYRTGAILRKIARQYGCGFFDLAQIWYDHPLNAPADLTDGNHPTAWTNAWMLSKIQELVFPIGLWKY